MAEKSAEWYEKQISQYKAELDNLNPKLNVANARVVELEGLLTETESMSVRQAKRIIELQEANKVLELARSTLLLAIKAANRNAAEARGEATE